MNRYKEQGDFDFLDMLAILAFIIQVLDYDVTISQTGNNSILNELKKDMEKIRQDNKKIINLLEQTYKGQYNK